jgi:hypothetical protein
VAKLYLSNLIVIFGIVLYVEIFNYKIIKVFAVH